MPNVFQRLGAALRGNPLDNPATPLSAAAPWMYDLFGGSPTSAGIAVNERTALQLATVYACINVLSQDISSLPLKVFELKGKNKLPAYDSDLYHLLAVQPNPEMTAPQFWAMVVACRTLAGNGYAEIQWEGPTPIALWPLHPRHVTPKRVDNQLVYQVTVNGEARQVQPKDMLHFRGLTLDGIVGLSPIQAAKQVIGTGLAAEKFGGGFFGRGSRPSGILTRTSVPTVPGTLGARTAPEDNDRVRESWERANAGDGQGRTAVLPAGWDWKQISISPEDAQFLETQGFNRTQIAGIWRIAPHMIGDTSRLSNSNHESQAQEHVTFTLRPYLVEIEAEVQCKLMPVLGRKAGKFSARFDTTEFTRGDFASLMASWAIGRQWGWLSANDVRSEMGKNPIGPQGDIYMVPLNMIDAGTINDPDGDQSDDVTPGQDQNPDDVPAGNGGMNQRKLLGRMADAYRRLFRDAAGRLQSRSVRNTDTVQQIFGALLASIADESVRQARSLFRFPAGTDLGTEKLLRETVKQLEKRSASWTATTADADADRELLYCIRAIAIHVYREAGSAIAQAA